MSPARDPLVPEGNYRPATAEDPRDIGREELLCKWAIEEGFDRAGIARLDRSLHEGPFRQWIENGDHAGMEYLARRIDERMDPSTRLEGSLAALCVAQHYPDRSGAESDLWSGVARYARGDDYHELMMARLRRLGDRIEQSFPGCRTRSYVDTGPILERELGLRAGLGSIGKNTLLLHRTGSYFLLGEILLTLDLRPAEILPDLCGHCTRCLDACPTGALPAAYRLDARRCISYWTIEHRGRFPEAVAAGNHGWSFGCDICQEVCPWNLSSNPRRKEPRNAEGFDLPDHRTALDLVSLATLERSQYTELFRRSPMKRAKLEGLQRNALSSLSEVGSGLLALCTASDQPKNARDSALSRLEGILETLLRSLDSEVEMVREAGLQALSRLVPGLRDPIFARSRSRLSRGLEGRCGPREPGDSRRIAGAAEEETPAEFSEQVAGIVAMVLEAEEPEIL